MTGSVTRKKKKSVGPRPDRPRRHSNSKGSSSCTTLARPTQLTRVGASIGHGWSPTLHRILSAHVPGCVADEEDGIVAMLVEAQRGLVETTPKAVLALRHMLAQMWQAWVRMGHSTAALARMAVTDENVGLAGIWKEIQDVMQWQVSTTTTSTSKSRAVVPVSISINHKNPGESSDLSSKQAFLDALLARMLHAFVQAKQAATVDLPEFMAPTPKTTLPEDEDISLQAMFMEVSRSFSPVPTNGARPLSETDVERHLLDRLQQISEESFTAEGLVETKVETEY